MAFYKANTEKEYIADNRGGEFISESGIYDVIIKNIIVNVGEKGSQTLDFKVEYKGNPLMLYGLRLTNNDGKANFQAQIFNKLCIITGIEEVNDPVEQGVLLYDFNQKKEVLQNVNVLEQFEDVEVKIWVRKRYSEYNGKIREQKEIQAFYRADDGATANEIVNGINMGIQIEKDLKYANKDKIDKGLTQEDIDAWKASKTNSTVIEEPKQEVKVTNPFAGAK